MLYEILNPSDKVIVQADDDTIAAMAVLLLGAGRYGLNRVDVEKDTSVQVLPIFLFGGDHEWMVERGIVPPAAKDGDVVAAIQRYVDINAEALARVYESVFYGRPGELAATEKLLERPWLEVPALSRANYNDDKRTSTNNIGACAAEFAQRIRERVTRNKVA